MNARPTETAPQSSAPIARWRLDVLRAMFFVWAAAGFFMVLPVLLDAQLSQRGMSQSMLAGLWVCSFIGLRRPLLMLPVFLFEFFWKLIWLGVYGVPQWLAGEMRPQLSEDLLAIGTGPFLFAAIIPWCYVWRRFAGRSIRYARPNVSA